MTVLEAWGYQISIPNRVTVTKRSPVEDFEIVELRMPDSKLLLRIYAGNHPKFNQGALQERPMSINGVAARSVAWEGQPGSVGGEILVPLPPCDGCPQFLHLQFSGLVSREYDSAQQIWNSLKPVTQ